MSKLTRKYIALEDLVEAIIDNRGKTVPTSVEGIPLIATNCIKHSSIYPTYDNIRYISSETFDTWFRTHLKPNDILFVNKGTPGRVCVVPNPVKFCAAQDMVGLRFKESVDYRYMFAVLRSDEIQKTIANNHVGLVIPHFRKQELVKMQLPIVDITVQRKIGQLYFDISNKIELNNRINTELEAMAKTIYDYWFVQFDFPDANGKPYKSSGGKMVYNDVLKREVPEGWEETTIGSLVNCYDSQRIPLSNAEREKKKGEIPYYGATGIMGYVDDFIFDKELILLAEDGSVMNENGNPIIQYVQGKAWINNHAHVLEPKDLESYDYLMQVFSYIPVINIMSGSIQKKITQDNFTGYFVCAADNKIVKKFNAFAKPLRQKITKLKIENQQLSQLRDWLLPMLMNGQVSVADAYQEAAQALSMAAEDAAGYGKKK